MVEIVQPQTREFDLSRVLAALSDPVRLRIVSEIHERGPVSCGDLGVSVCKSTLSHHLKILREAGVTWTQSEGVERFLTLRYDCLNERFPGLLDSVLGAALPHHTKRKKTKC